MNISNIDRSEVFRRFPRIEYASWVDPEVGYFYVETPKVGCSTIKSILQSISGFPLPKDPMAIHYRQPPESYVRSFCSYEREVAVARGDESLFSFCFVRDPLSRLVSAYSDKILNAKGRFWDRYRREIRNKFSLDEKLKIEFWHFVEYVAAIPDVERDIHWRSQASLLRPDLIRYDFIGRQETFKDDLAYVLGVLRVADYRKYLGMRVNESVAKVSLPDVETHLTDRVHDIYSCDYEIFGYSG